MIIIKERQKDRDTCETNTKKPKQVTYLAVLPRVPEIVPGPQRVYPQNLQHIVIRM